MAKNKESDQESAVESAAGNAVSTEVDYSGYSGSGFENQDNSDIQVPFLRILQSLSPEVKPVEKGGIEGAQVGRLFNTVTQECYDEVMFVPAVTRHVYNEWIPMTEGGGFVGSYEVTDKFVHDALADSKAADLPFGTVKTADGHDLVETFDLYGILVAENNEPMPCIISFTSSKIKVYRKWMSAIRMFVLPTPTGKVKPDLFAHLVRVSTQEETNKANQEYSNFKLAPANVKLLDPLLGSDSDLFLAGRDMHQMVKDGIAKADMSTADGGGASTPAAGGGEAPPF